MNGHRMGRAVRRILGGLLAGALLTAAVAFYLYAPRLDLVAGRDLARSAEPAPGGPRSSPRASEPTEAAPDSEPSPGPGGRDSSISLLVRVAAEGVFEVTETVRLAAPTTQLQLVPPDVRLAGGTLDKARAVASDLEVDADNRAVGLDRRSVRGPTTVRLRSATDRFELRYRLHGTIKVSERSPEAGRATGALGPLVAGVPDDLPVTVAFRSEAVLNLTCPCLPPAEQTCFAGERPDVRVGPELARKDALVGVQLDLRAAE